MKYRTCLVSCALCNAQIHTGHSDESTNMYKAIKLNLNFILPKKNQCIVENLLKILKSFDSLCLLTFDRKIIILI